MSSIASNSEDLVLNADGGSSEVKFKINGTEKASLNSSGVITATTFTGAATDSTKLPLAGGTMTGDLLIHKQNPAITFKPTGGNNAMKLMFKDENDDVKFTLGYQDSVSAFRLSSTDINATDYIHVKTDGKIGISNDDPPETFTIADTTTKGWSVNIENNVCNIRSRSSASDTQTHAYFLNTNGVVGKIQTVHSSTSFNTSSDYRLKENVDYTWDATTRLKQLKPARFNWISDDTNTLVDGFIAHEVSSIVPEAISGTKDAVDANGDIDPQGIDQSKLVPLLVKTIQEQQTTIESLEARITTLEG